MSAVHVSGLSGVGTGSDTTTIQPATPTIGTAATASVFFGGVISDLATVNGVAGGPSITGTVTFRLFGPDNATCAGTPVFVSAGRPLGGGPPPTATSSPFTPTSPGVYRWLATYDGDVNYAAVSGLCNAAGETSTVPAAPFSTSATSSVVLGGAITDTATVTVPAGSLTPTGAVSFTVYGPDNATCTGAAVFTSLNRPLSGSAVAGSAPFTPAAVGVYRWVAVYSGDANYASAISSCNAPGESSTVTARPTPQLTTVASAGNVGDSIFDTATLAGGASPTGSLTFQLFGPDDATCSRSAIFTSLKTATGNGKIVSDTFTLPSPGTYRFVALYGGDANNSPVGPTSCAEPLERIVAERRAVSLTTRASDPTVVGNTVSDTATLGGGFNPTGTIVFSLFGPDNATCSSAALFTSTKPVSGNGFYLSDPFAPAAPGAYRWVAAYSGDTNNLPRLTACDDQRELVQVSPLPIIVVDKTATPESLPVPGGTFTFPVVVTNSSNVALTIRSLSDDVYGDVTRIQGSTCNTAIGTVLAAGPGPGNTYSCRFPGDFRGPSNASQTDVVTVTATDARGNTVRDTDDAIVRITTVPPSITTTKTVATPSLPEPGGSTTFSYSVTNTGPEAVTITSLVDDVYGDLNGRGTCAIGARLAPNGGGYKCTFTGNVFGDAGATQTDTITTTGRDDRGQTVSSQSRATVTIVDVPPSIRVTKTPQPVSRPEPGGTFRFTVSVTNTSFEPVTVTALTDDVYGDLNGRGSCAVGAALAANGGTYGCAFDGDFRGRAGAQQTDTVTATAVDNDKTSVTAKASATVSLTGADIPPVVSPPPPQPPTPPVTVAPPPASRLLVRTGGEVAGAARLAAILLVLGMAMLAAVSVFDGRGPGLAWAGGTGFRPRRRPTVVRPTVVRPTVVDPTVVRPILGAVRLTAGLDAAALDAVDSRPGPLPATRRR